MFYYVYLIKSLKHPNITYVGCSYNLEERLATHNSGGSIYTLSARPWELVICITFKDKLKAFEFEKYLKSHAGRAFAKKRLW